MFEDYEENLEDIKDVQPKYDEKGNRIPQRGEWMMWLSRGMGMVRLKPFMFARMDYNGRKVIALNRFENIVSGDIQITENSKDDIAKEDVFWLDEELRSDVSKSIDCMIANKNKARQLCASKLKKVFTVRSVSEGHKVTRGEKLMWLTKGDGFLTLKPIEFAKLSGQKVAVLIEAEPGKRDESSKDNISKDDVYFLDEAVMKEMAEYSKLVGQYKKAAREIFLQRAKRVFEDAVAVIDPFAEDDEKEEKVVAA